MMDGFDLDSPLVCEGIVGDGCGGGRLFFIKDESLFAYEPITKDKTLLLNDIVDAVCISKSVCIITIVTKSKIIKFDLSKLAVVI